MNAPLFRRWPLAVALLLPQLAHADALSALGYAYAFMALLVLFAMVTLTLMGASYLLPRWRWLHWVQLVFFAISVGLGLLTYGESLSEGWGLFGRHNPLLSFCLPVGAWLNAVVWARRARHDGARLVWVGVAVVALHFLLMLVPDEALGFYFRQGGSSTQLFYGAYLLVSLVAGLLSWVVVWWQLPLAVRVLVKQVWWRAPAVAAAVGLLYYAVYLTVVLNHHERGMLGISLPWDAVLWQSLQSLVFTWVVGVVALRLIPAPAAPPAAGIAE